MNIRSPEWQDMPRQNGSWDNHDQDTRLLAAAYMVSHYTAALAREGKPLPWAKSRKDEWNED